MRKLAWLVVLPLLGVACRSSSPPAATDAPQTPTAPPPATASPPPPPSAALGAPAPGGHGCTTDADCTNSCRHGAVNRSWWEAQYPGGEACEDGCASKGTEAPRCEQGKCIAYRMGTRSAECTEKHESVVPGPGPAHRCQADADCQMSCRYGAVNANWYSWGAKNECKDGCAEGRAAVCQRGACVAMLGSKLDPDCTRVSIFAKQ